MSDWAKPRGTVLWLGVEPEHEDAELGELWESPDGLMVMGPDGWEPAP